MGDLSSRMQSTCNMADTGYFQHRAVIRPEAELGPLLLIISSEQGHRLPNLTKN